MSKLDAKVFSSITPFSKQWILGEELMYEFLYNYQDFLNDGYGIIDLGTLNWNSAGGTGLFYTPFVTSARYCDIASTIYHKNSVDNTGAVENLGVIMRTDYIFIKNEAYTDAAAFKTAMSGVYLIYEFADNIGRVRLGSLTYTYYQGCFSTNILDKKTATNKLYCDKYTTKPAGYASSYPDDDKIIYSAGVEQRQLWIKDTQYGSDTAAFKSSLTNTYLYYEKI